MYFKHDLFVVRTMVHYVDYVYDSIVYVYTHASAWLCRPPTGRTITPHIHSHLRTVRPLFGELLLLLLSPGVSTAAWIPEYFDEICAPIKSTKDIIHIAPELEIGEAACKFIYWLSVLIPAHLPRFTQSRLRNLCDDVLLV